MAKPLVKFCGMTEPEQVSFACDLGVDAIGMILHAVSPRCISLAQAAAIRDVVPETCSLLGVFVDADADFVHQACDTAGLDLLQLHGAETDGFGAQLPKPFIKAIQAKTQTQVNDMLVAYPSACAMLLDPYVSGQHGGTGELLNPSLWPLQSEQNLILAGGLSADNIATRIRSLQPWGVDLNSGLEDSPGQKSFDLMSQAMDRISSMAFAE